MTSSETSLASTQESFELGKDPVQHMVCGGVGGKYKYLFAGARDGTIQVLLLLLPVGGANFVSTP